VWLYLGDLIETPKCYIASAHTRGFGNLRELLQQTVQTPAEEAVWKADELL
jgi:hypothetical protein